jgi:hypothetical protein
MSKNMKIAVPLILVLLLVGLYFLRGQIMSDGGTPMAASPDAGPATVIAADVFGLDVGGMAAGANRDAGPRATGDAGSPGKIPACGNCSLNPKTGQLSLQMQTRLPIEEAHNWTVLGVEIIYNNGNTANPALKADGSSPTLTAADVNCSNTKNFTIVTGGYETTGIRAINVRLRSASGIPFKRTCVKLASEGTTTILEKDCNCCNCALCNDVGFCQ